MPGDSKATAGTPNVDPRRAESAPPSECPVSQMFASGYKRVRLLYRFWEAKVGINSPEYRTTGEYTYNTDGIE